MDVVTLAICNKKIAGVLAGIDRIEVDDPNKRLTFYFPNGTSASMNFPIPRDGASITDIKVNEEGYLVCRMSDGTTVVSDDPIQTASASTVSYKDNKTVEDVLDELLESGGGTGGSVDGITVPTKTSDLTNDSGFITSIPSEYITETELETKGYLTEHQSLTDYAKKTDIPDVSDFLTEVPEGYVTDTKLSTELNKKVNKEAGKGLSTNDLTNELVTKINSSATEAFVTNAIANAQLGDKEVDLSGYATVDALNLKADLTHTHDQYLTKVPDEYITETELTAKGYLTSHQDISSLQTKTDKNLTTTSKEVVGAINEVKDKADLILDTEVRLDKTYSSSKIYSAIQDAIDSSKNFTLDEIGKISGASYKVVTSTTEMTDEKIIYLLENGATYDMYIVETAGTVTKIGDTAIDLSSYLKTTDAESAYLKKTEATSTYATQISFNNHINDTVAHLTQLEKNKLLTTDNITSTINSSSDNTQVPSAKATYDLANTKANTNHTHNASDITDLSIPSKTSELENDSNYLSTEDITNTINSTSTETEIPTAKAVNVAIKGKLITRKDIDTYGKEIIKFPVGKWTIGSVAISNLTDLPNSYVRYIEIMGTSEVTNPWTNDNTIRSYKATSYKGDTFLRSLNSGSEAGVITSDTGWQRVLLNGDIIDNLTSTDTNKLLSANQGKILNDTKLNKTDANKLDCITIDNVSLKEYILTNFTEREKTYYLIARQACTDLPKASNFYITVETPGSYTYKVTAKELNDNNGSYVCTYRTVSSTWTAWEKVCTTTVAYVRKTFIELVDSTNYSVTESSTHSFYRVINGVCYVDIILKCVSPKNENTDTPGHLTLPKPKDGFYVALNGFGGADGVSDNVVMSINNDGISFFKYGTANGLYMGHFSYPVAE